MGTRGPRRLLALALVAAWLAAGARERAGVLWVSEADSIALEPSLAVDARDRLWLAWVALREEDGRWRAAVEGACVDGGRVLARFALPGSGELPAAPSLAPDGEGVRCAFEAGPGDDRGLWCAALALEEGAVAVRAPERVPCGAVRPLEPQLVALGAGAFGIAFQGWDGSSYDAYWSALGEDGAWRPARDLTDTPDDVWRPRARSAGDGVAHLVFDRFDGESFDVAYARVVDGALEGELRVASGPAFQAYPELALAPDGAAWMAWEEAPQFGRRGGLRPVRATRLARVEGDELRRAAPALQDGSTPRADLPRVFAGAGGVVVSHRSPTRATPKVEGKPFWYTAWLTTCTSFDAEGAPQARVLEESDGDNEATEAFAQDGRGRLWLALASDSRRAGFGRVDEWGEPIEGRWRVGLLELDPPAGSPALAAAERPGAGPARRAAAPPPATGPGRTRPPSRDGRRLLFGDLHRHTHVSRCSGSKDGTFADAYRYARGPGGLDFVAVADHYQHMRPWTWWRSLREVERYHAPGGLVTLAAVERVAPRRGHFNDVYLDPREVSFDPVTWKKPPGRFAPAPDEHVISIPHMMGIRDRTAFDWEGFRPERNRVLEVYQGYRGSYEGEGLPYEAVDYDRGGADLASGLARGAQFGLIASSDHSSSGTSFAGVWAREVSRAAVFGALHERRTFAATAPCSVEARVGELRQGAEGALARDAFHAPFEVEVRRDAPLAYVELVKNGATVQRRAGGGDEELFAFHVRSGVQPGGPPLVVEATGGALVAAELRQADTAEARAVVDDGRAVLRREGFAPVDLVVRVRWSGPEARRALHLRSGPRRLRLGVDALHAGRADKGGFGRDELGLWRLGAPLGQVGGRFAFEDPARASGDVYYARVAWEDGNVAWTSPIRVHAVEPSPREDRRDADD